MRALRPLSVWCLLATIVVGGVAGPSLHRVQHAVEQAANASGEPCHAPAVHHADEPLWTEHGTRKLVPECDLCATRLLVVPSSQAPAVAPHRSGTPHTTTYSHLISAVVPAGPCIRGPPDRA